MIACTGRPFPGALPWVERLGLAGPIICYQGAQVRNLDGTVLLEHGIAHQTAMEVIRFARKRNLHVQAYREDQLIVEHDREEAQLYATHAGMQVHVVEDLDRGMGETTPKLVIVSSPEVLERLLPVVRSEWRGRLNAATSVPNDASMIAWAGLGVAVEGSPPEVIAAADRTIPGPGHGGIQQLAQALLK